MPFIRLADLPPRPWPNGLGTTREVAAGPGWGIGVADLGAEAAFSHFPSQDRIFTLLDGPGATLLLEGRADLPCRPLVPVHFPGDVPTLYRPHGGPARAFNVIADRTAWRARVTVLALAAGHPLRLPPTDAIFLAEGTLLAGGTRLRAGDTLLTPGAAPGPLEATGAAATAILVDLAPA